MLKIKIPENALNIEQMAQLLGCGKKTIHKYKKKGLIPKPIHLNSKKMFWLKDVIENWLTEKQLNEDDKNLPSSLKNL